jgi:hypothetical protein
MPKGLAFLSKKSWHTSKLCNQEKVWIAEQQQKAEEVKIKELAKQIQKEREEEELNRISGKKSNRLDRGIDWMYQGGPRSDGKPSAYEEEQKRKEQEDYLLGKEFNPDNAKKGDLAVAESAVGVNVVLTRTAGNQIDETLLAKEKIHHNDVQDWNSNFHLRHEDPMFFVEQQRRAQVEHQEKKQRLLEKVNNDEGRHHRGDNYRKRRGRDREDNGRISYSSESEDRKHRRKERKRRHRSRKRRERSRSMSSELRHSRRYREDDDSERKKVRYDRHTRKHRTRSYSRSRSRSRSIDDSCRGKMNDKEFQAKENVTMSYGTASDQIRKSFGLIGSTTPVSTSDLGPDKMLLAKKIQEREEAKSRYTHRGGSIKRKDNGHDTRKMTQEEREKALNDMQVDASKRMNHISKSQLVSNSDLYEDEIKRRRERSVASTNFLHDIARQSHGIDQDLSLASRVSQNRNKSQRNNDDHFL